MALNILTDHLVRAASKDLKTIYDQQNKNNSYYVYYRHNHLTDIYTAQFEGAIRRVFGGRNKVISDSATNTKLKNIIRDTVKEVYTKDNVGTKAYAQKTEAQFQNIVARGFQGRFVEGFTGFVKLKITKFGGKGIGAGVMGGGTNRLTLRNINIRLSDQLTNLVYRKMLQDSDLTRVVTKEVKDTIKNTRAGGGSKFQEMQAVHGLGEGGRAGRNNPQEGPQDGLEGGSARMISVVEILKALKSGDTSDIPEVAKIREEFEKHSILDEKDLETAVDNFTAPLDVKYTLGRKRISNIVQHNDEIIVNMEISNKTHNEQYRDVDKGPTNAPRNSPSIQNTLKQAETSAIAEVNRIGNNISTQTLSTPLNKRADLIARKALVKKITGVASTPDMRLKVNKRLAAQYKDESEKKKYKETANIVKGKRSAVKRTKPKKARTGTIATAAAAGREVERKAGQNPLALRNLLNELLPQQVAKNMVAPALVYRTGRFANSVQVDDINMGNRMTNISYTYRRDPYETFALGGAKYTPYRDPDKLIRKSLREVAIGIVGGKFGMTGV